jgi:hypothetical protein
MCEYTPQQNDKKDDSQNVCPYCFPINFGFFHVDNLNMKPVPSRAPVNIGND